MNYPDPDLKPLAVNGMQYIGCYVDDTNRDMGKYYTITTSLGICQALCEGYSFFAMQFGHACFCSDTYSTSSNYPKVADSNCGTNRLGAEYKNAVFFMFIKFI